MTSFSPTMRTLHYSQEDEHYLQAVKAWDDHYADHHGLPRMNETDPLIGRDVDVYFNLHRKVWSVRDRKTRRVIAHAKSIVLMGVTFRVSTAGNARVRAEGRKNVHAFARGTVLAFDAILPHDEAVSVTYNPYKYTTFVEEATKRPVHQATIAWFGPRTVFALDTEAQSGKVAS